MLPDTNCITCIHLSPSTCILYRRQIYRHFVVRLLLDTKDTISPLWHKWIVIMSPRYSLHVTRTSNLYPLTLYPVKSCSSWIHVSGRHVSWCKRGLSYSLSLVEESHVLQKFSCLTSSTRKRFRMLEYEGIVEHRLSRGIQALRLPIWISIHCNVKCALHEIMS